MCGILGCNFSTNFFNEALTLLNNRGPDFNSTFTFNEITLGHTRLSIIDLDSEANQPMTFNNLTIVFNGEIYNYKELVLSESLTCLTNSDTEVIIRLYEKYGEKCLNKLNGMFSFVIFNHFTNSFFCAKDRFGKKPFFYYFKDNKFIFSSSLKSIIKILGFTPKLNKIALSQYLQYFVPLDDNTFYSDIKKLEASSYMIIKDNSLYIKKYYKINTYKAVYDENIALKNIEELLFKSVNLRLVSDVEVGTLLSGGVDSSLISSIYSKISGKQINTFSVGYSDYSKYSELPFALEVSKHIGSNHHEILINKNDFIESFDDTINALEQPHADSAAFPLFHLTKYIKNFGIKTVLSGEGSDELFLGYDNYSKFLNYYKFASSLTNEQSSFLSEIASALQNNTKESEYLRRVIQKENIYNSFGEIFTTLQKKRLFKKVPTFKSENSKSDPVDWMSYIDLKIWLGQSLLSKVDSISMYNSIEVRTPFLDVNLVNYVFSIDSDLKVGNTNKYLLKQIANKYLPSSIVNRTKKGFNPPYNEWLFDEYKDELLNLVLSVNSETGLFNDSYINQIFNLAKVGKFKQHFWSLYIFSFWFKENYL